MVYHVLNQQSVLNGIVDLNGLPWWRDVLGHEAMDHLGAMGRPNMI